MDSFRRLGSTGNNKSPFIYEISNVSKLVTNIYDIYTDSGGYNGTWLCPDMKNVYKYSEHLASNLSGPIHHHCKDEDHELPAGVFIVLYCAFILFVGCVFKYFQHRFHIPIPYTVILLLAGILFEIWEIYRPNAFGALASGFQDVRCVSLIYYIGIYWIYICDIYCCNII